MNKEIKDLWTAIEGLTQSMQNIATALETITEFTKTVTQKLLELEIK